MKPLSFCLCGSTRRSIAWIQLPVPWTQRLPNRHDLLRTCFNCCPTRPCLPFFDPPTPSPRLSTLSLYGTNNRRSWVCYWPVQLFV